MTELKEKIAKRFKVKPENLNNIKIDEEFGNVTADIKEKLYVTNYFVDCGFVEDYI